jgi:hypothetical protein
MTAIQRATPSLSLPHQGGGEFLFFYSPSPLAGEGWGGGYNPSQS